MIRAVEKMEDHACSSDCHRAFVLLPHWCLASFGSFEMVDTLDRRFL